MGGLQGKGGCTVDIKSWSIMVRSILADWKIQSTLLQPLHPLYSINELQLYHSNASLTEFWTIFMRCLLILVTMAEISTTFSLGACSRAVSIAISVPVLPIPALQGEKEEMMELKGETIKLIDNLNKCLHTYVADLQWTSVGPLESFIWAFIRLR